MPAFSTLQSVLMSLPPQARASEQTHDLVIGTSPLHEAAKAGHREVIEALVGAGADLEACDEQGRTALQVRM